MGSDRDAATIPPSTTTRPPPIFATAETAAKISSELTPTAAMLWESWATEVAMAPLNRPNPETRPRPKCPVPRASPPRPSRVGRSHGHFGPVPTQQSALS